MKGKPLTFFGFCFMLVFIPWFITTEVLKAFNVKVDEERLGQWAALVLVIVVGLFVICGTDGPNCLPYC